VVTDRIGLERPKHCDDWECPARVSCARHFGRSSAYAAMRREHESTGHGPGTWYFRGIKEHCPRYEFDKPKEWLMPKPGQVTHLPPGTL